MQRLANKQKSITLNITKAQGRKWNMSKQEKRISKLIQIIIVTSIAIIATSCLEITQHISMNGNAIRTNTRVTIQKSLFYLADSFDAGFSMDDFPIDSIGDNISQKYIKNIEQIDTEQEYGASLTLEYSANDALAQIENIDNSFLLPVKLENKLILFIKPTEMDYDSDTQGMMEMIFSSYKYRLYISKSVLANPQKVTVTRNDTYFEANLITYPDFTALELPLTIIFGEEPFQVIIE